MRLLLDTHFFLWYITNDVKLPGKFVDAIRDPANEVFLSVISQWEITIKCDLGRLALPQRPDIYFPAQRRGHRIKSLDITEGSVNRLSGLPAIHRDPFDRMLVSQALAEGLTLLTVDPDIPKYPVAIF